MLVTYCLALSLMGTFPVVAQSRVAVVAEDSEAFRESVFSQPVREWSFDRGAVLSPVSVNMVDSKESKPGFATARTSGSVVVNDLLSNPPFPFSACGPVFLSTRLPAAAVAGNAIRISSVWSAFQPVESRQGLVLSARTAPFGMFVAHPTCVS